MRSQTRWPRTAALALALALVASQASRASDAPEVAPPPTREFAPTDLNDARRAAIATIQDLGFALESVDADTGDITASRLDTHPLRISITISQSTDASISATVKTFYADLPIQDPRVADAFFSAYADALAPPVDF